MATKPPWLRVRLGLNENFLFLRRLLLDLGLHTVCEQANCPNAVECWNRRTATFLILGDRCSRGCNFCAVARGPQKPPEADEPERVSRAVSLMGLSFAVITSVTRDDLPDGGAGHFAETISAIRRMSPQTLVEVLVPDFKGSQQAIETVAQACPEVLGHNVETVPRLYPMVRPGADYGRSLALFDQARGLDGRLPLKSGLMLGLGESRDEVESVMDDLLAAGCTILTLGQYLQPTKDHIPVERFVTPEEFDEWGEKALAMGFSGVAAAPLVRSSYRAKELYLKAKERMGTRKDPAASEKRQTGGSLDSQEHIN
ncbi:MAG TPA: lipoyl synthase [Syntrophorhabdales bacterium]|nr:lipoyl synthase [Syntrophorhabdales bacterium]